MCFQRELGQQFNPVVITMFQKDKPIQITSGKRMEFIRRIQPDLLNHVGFKHSWTSKETRTRNWKAVQNCGHSISPGRWVSHLYFSVLISFILRMISDLGSPSRNKPSQAISISLPHSSSLKDNSLGVLTPNSQDRICYWLAQSRTHSWGWELGEGASSSLKVSSFYSVPSSQMSYIRVLSCVPKVCPFPQLSIL